MEPGNKIDRPAGKLNNTAIGAYLGRGEPGLLVMGFFRQRAPYGTQRPHGTQDWLLTYTLRGQGLYRQPGVEYRTAPGDLVLLEPGAFHDYGCVPGRPWVFVWAHFIARPDWLAHLDWPPLGKGLRLLRLGTPAERQRVRAALLRAHGDAQGGLGEELAATGLEEAILVADRVNRSRQSAQPLSPEIQRVVERLTQNLQENPAVADLARLANLSPSRLAHRFKAETGDAPIAYLLKLRLRQGARLLAFSALRIKEIARELGFESPFYFSRQFRGRYGTSPRAFRIRALRARSKN